MEETFQKRNNVSVDMNYSFERAESYIKAKLKISMSSASRVYDELRKGIIKTESDSLIVETFIPNNEWIYNYFLGYGHDLEVLEPKELRESFKEFINGILKKYP